jgi:hypothetical protein
MGRGDVQSRSPTKGSAAGHNGPGCAPLSPGEYDGVNNPHLPESQVEELIEQIGEENIGGSVVVEGNGPG